MKNSSYAQMVAGYAKAFREGKNIPNGAYACPIRPTLPQHAPKALIFSPHPDDECIIGGLGLRLLKESGVNVINVAVTQGSNHHRGIGRTPQGNRQGNIMLYRALFVTFLLILIPF